MDPDEQLKNLRISGLFALLDFFGFWADVRTTYEKGSRFADSRHAFNGSHFTMMVSRDRRLLRKAEAAYVHYSIKTTTMDTEAFKAHLQQVCRASC